MVIYTDEIDNITPAHLTGPFFVGWPNPPAPPAHLRILQGSSQVMLAVDDETGQVVGFINALSDGVMAAFIPLLEVTPAYQGQGIGTELVRHMLEKLKHLYAIDLMADESVHSFYERFGMMRLSGLGLRNYDRQSCE